jgi:sugar transferase (PEP-CTERM/EpsH1 system associated)
LAQRHDVTAAYFIDDPDDKEYESILRRICHGNTHSVILNLHAARARGLAAVLSGRSFSEGYFYSRALENMIDRLIQRGRYDLVYAFSSPMGQYLRRYPKIPLLMDFVDVDSHKWTQLAEVTRFPAARLLLIEAARLANYEIAISARARCSLFVSDAEANLFRSIGGQGDILALSNGVDSDLLRLPICEPRGGARGSNGSPRPARLIFAGTMNYLPNADAVLYFAREILPRIRRDFPQAVFDVVGRYPTRAVRKLHGVGGVRVLGEVGDLRGHIIQADVSVAPLRIARGIQNKILEAMAIGIPVVATPAAVEGIEVQDEKELLVADTPDSFARQVVRLLGDAQLRSRIGKKARTKMLQEYSWNQRGEQLEKILQEKFFHARIGVAQRGT